MTHNFGPYLYTWRTSLIFLIILIGARVIEMVIVDFIFPKDSKKVGYVGFPVKKFNKITISLLKTLGGHSWPF